MTKLKEYLTQPPLLSPSVIGEKMYLYLAVSNTTISSALVREEETVQKRVYYTSQAFPGAKANYPKLDKIVFALVVASRKLCPSHHRHDRSTNKKDDEQDKCNGAAGSMGHRARLVRHRISAIGCNQGLDPS